MTRALLLLAVSIVTVSTPCSAEPVAEGLLRAQLARRYDDILFRRAAIDPNAAVRVAATRAAAGIRDGRALAWLRSLLEDESGPVRRGALFACGQIAGALAREQATATGIGTTPAAIFIALRQRLGQAPAGDLPALLDAIGKTRDERAATTVLQSLRHGGGVVRGAAALALARVRDAAVLPELRAALAVEEDAEARWRMTYAAWLLLRERSRRLRPANTGANSASAGTAAARPGPRSAPGPDWTRTLFVAAGRARPYAERVFAVRALAWVTEGRRRIPGLLDDPDPRIVEAAALGFSIDWSPAEATRLLDLLGNDEPLVRSAALRAIAAGGPEARPLLVEATRKLAGRDNALYRSAVVQANGLGAAIRVAAPANGDDEGRAFVWRAHATLPEFLPSASPAGPLERLAAAEVCANARVPASRALPLLLELGRDKDPVLRATAIRSLSKRGDRAQSGYVVALAKESTGHRFHGARVAAANALAGWKAYDPWLRVAAADPAHPVRAAARSALRALGRAEPAVPRRAAFSLQGAGAAQIATQAAALRGARLRIETNRGTMEAVLYPDDAPVHCVNVARLVRQGFYDGLSWHRVVGNFVIQGGCPRGDGSGGPGYFVPDELGPRPFVRGTLGMPRAGPDTGGCQLFFTHLPTPHLDGAYTVFGQIVRGFAVLDRIRVTDKIVKVRVELPSR